MAEFVLGFVIGIALILIPHGVGYLVSDYNDTDFEIWLKGLFTIAITAVICAIIYGIGTVALHISNFWK